MSASARLSQQVVRRWKVSGGDWTRFDAECLELTRGRSDLEIKCFRPGELLLVRKESPKQKAAEAVQ